MRFGYFDDETKEYVITRTDTPLPWINYLGCRPTSASSPIPPADILFIATRGCGVSRATATITRRLILAGGIWIYPR